jgi:hypothetical protein
MASQGDERPIVRFGSSATDSNEAAGPTMSVMPRKRPSATAVQRVVMGHEPTLHAWFEMNEAANRAASQMSKLRWCGDLDKDVAGSGAIEMSTAPVMVCTVDFSWR